VQDGVTKNFFQRVWLSLKLSFIQRSRYFKGCFGLREQGFLRATIGQVGFESLRERMEIAEDESQEILAKYLKSRSHVDDLVNSENLLRDKMKELNEYEKKSGKPLSKWKYPF
jgi:hypothetical protein